MPPNPPRSTPPTIVALRPITTPLSVGFLALAVASFVMSGLEVGWVDPLTQSHAIALALLGFAVPLQLGSAAFGFLTRDPVATAGLGLLGGSWLAVGTVMATSAEGAKSSALGLLLVSVAVGLMVPAIAGSATKLSAATVLMLAAARFVATGGYELGGGSGWKHLGAVLGFVTAAAALYTALALELEGALHRTVLPIGRRGAGREAMHGDFAQEVAGVEHEAGVRRQL
jgi:succinate-acetate transporter protein